MSVGRSDAIWLADASRKGCAVKDGTIEMGLVVLAVGASLTAAFGLGSDFGYKRATEKSAKATVVRQSLEQRMMDWIVERNPDAKVREFNGFPQAVFEAAQESGLEWSWLLALADHESGMNPSAVGTSGEIGLTQIMSQTGRKIAEQLHDSTFVGPSGPGRSASGRITYKDLGSLGDPRVNIRYGAMYLRWQKEQFKRWEIALQAYNRGADHALDKRPWDQYAKAVAFSYIQVREAFADVQ